MNRLKLDEDIVSLSEFRANTASMLEKIKKEERPLVITQHGKGSAVILDVSVYENMVETIEVFRDIIQSENELNDGEGIPSEEVIDSLKKRLKQHV